jgi:hypothetical protein
MKFDQCRRGFASTAILFAAAAIRAFGIQSGTADSDTPKNNAVVRFTVGGADGVCTGTLISNNLVLTAGHCVGGRSLPAPPPHPPFNTTYRTPGSDWQFPGAWYPVNNAILGSFDVTFGADRSGMTANADRIGPWETFRIIDTNGGALVSNDPINLRTSQSCYLCAEYGGGSWVTSNRTSALEWETFRIRKLSPGAATLRDGDVVAFQAYNRNYVTAEGGGGGTVNADRTLIGAWERFTLRKAAGSAGDDIRGGDSIAIQAGNGQYVVAEWGGLCALRFAATAYSLPGFADIILLQLNRPVPPEIALPAAVLTAPPAGAVRDPNAFWSSQTFDIVGWGPTSDGGGTPRFRQRARSSRGQTPCAPYGSFTPTYFCVANLDDARLIPGDSGSPLFWTSPASGRQYLIGVAQGDERYTPTFARGGADDLGNRTPDIGLWLEQALRLQNCLPLDTALSVRHESDGSWTLYKYGYGILRDFNRDESAARDTLRAIQHYGATQYCWVDSPGPEHSAPAYMEYFLRSGGPVYGAPAAGESCTPFTPASLVVRFAGGGRWEVAEPISVRPVAAFGSDPLVDYVRATESLQVIRQNSFSRLCTAGASAPYFR